MTVLLNIFLRQTLTDDFWGLHKNMNCTFHLSTYDLLLPPGSKEFCMLSQNCQTQVKIFQNLLHDFEIVSDHFGTLCVKESLARV